MPLHTRIIETNLERNMTSQRMRAFYWRYLAAQKDCSGGTPHISDISSDAFAGLEPWSLRLLALPDGDFLYTQYGQEISNSTGFSMVGRKVSSNSSKAFDFFLKCYRRVKDERRPLLTFNSALASRSVASWHRLLVPALDEAGQLNIVTILHPVCLQDSVINALMQAVSDPILILKMVRDDGEDAIDANIVNANTPAKDLLAGGLLGPSHLRHCNLTDVMPTLLDEPYRSCLAAAYAEGQTTTIEEPIAFAGQTFAAITASPVGDGAAILLKTAKA